MWMWQETLLQNFVKFGVKLKKFATLVTMTTAAILNLFNPQKLPHTTVDIPTKFDERNPKKNI